ncbi:hypothetical protein [Thermophilibacter provencensis]|uniref:Uncharacterized protein n=1 Tax=Thermophilibacter provencensis TaxID=1852386 RepID=A0ABT7V5H0_9ACTN|nr:hypothetical protein [Thermophilibacter provencensis]MDM8271221.1 hypothetical protein [Thermophilibacter provencensis]
MAICVEIKDALEHGQWRAKDPTVHPGVMIAAVNATFSYRRSEIDADRLPTIISAELHTTDDVQWEPNSCSSDKSWGYQSLAIRAEVTRSRQGYPYLSLQKQSINNS